MITGELKSKVHKIWDTMWSGGISTPRSVIEQLVYLLSIKRLDELQTLKEAKAARTCKLTAEPIFTRSKAYTKTRFCVVEKTESVSMKPEFRDNKPGWRRMDDARPSATV